MHVYVHNRALTRTRSDNGNGKSQDMRHGQNHEVRSGYSENCMSNLGNPYGMRPDNKCITGIQDQLSSDNTLGSEAIGQHVKTNGKPKGISHLTRMPIIADTTPVPQIYSGLKRKGDSAHIQRGNPN